MDILTTTGPAATANGFGCSSPSSSSSPLHHPFSSPSKSQSSTSTSKKVSSELSPSSSSSAHSTPSVSPTSPTTEENRANNGNDNVQLSSSGSNSDNSSTDEGIGDHSEEALLEEEDDDEDEDEDEDDHTLVSENHHSHSHHEHHSNHHYQHHLPHRRSRSRSRQRSGESRSSKGTTTTFTEVPSSAEAEEQVERFLNGTSAKNLADLEAEAANLRREIADLEDPHSRRSTPTETNLDDDDLEGEDDDEELREFQAIEREIKAAELRKCLQTIERRIEQCKEEIRVEKEEAKEVQLLKHKAIKPNNLLSRTFDQFATDSMTDSMIEECRQAADAASQLKNYTAEDEEDEDENHNENNDKESSSSKPRAPLAVADEEEEEEEEDWGSSESPISSAFSPSTTQQTTTTTATKPSLPLSTTIAKLHLSADSENEEEEEEEEKEFVKNAKNENLQKSPPVPPRKQSSLQPSEQSSTVGGPEAILFNVGDFYRTSLHEDALHESIEASLQAVNGLTTADEEEAFLISSAKPPLPVRKAETPSSPPKSTSIVRRESQYENETAHECGVTHRRGYERIQAANRKLQNGTSSTTGTSTTSPEEKCHSLDDLLNGKPTREQEEEEMAYRRRSAKFPTEAEAAAAAAAATTNSSINSSVSAASSVTFRAKRNSESLNTVNGNHHPHRHHQLEQSTSSLNSASHLRPLTLYLPSPNEELNLITHLHTLGHDLTSSTVTHSLLITPFTCSGYLYKQCAGSSSKWRKRYFHFNRVRKVFVYFSDRSAFEKRRHPKRGVFFDEVQDVYVDHTRMKSKSKLFGGGSHSGHSSPSHLATVSVSSPAKHDSHQQNSSSSSRCVFVVATTTTNRKFILSTFSPELMRIWMDVIFTGANAYLQDYESYDA